MVYSSLIRACLRSRDDIPYDNMARMTNKDQRVSLAAEVAAGLADKRSS